MSTCHAYLAVAPLMPQITYVGLACSQAPNNPLCLDNHSLSGTPFLNFCTEYDANKLCSVCHVLYICLMLETLNCVACCRKLAVHTKVTVCSCLTVFFLFFLPTGKCCFIFIVTILGLNAEKFLVRSHCDKCALLPQPSLGQAPELT